MFSQFWCEFTKMVLVEFFEEDLVHQSGNSKAFSKPNTTKLSQFVQNASKDIKPRLNEPSRVTISAVELQLLNQSQGLDLTNTIHQSIDNTQNLSPAKINRSSKRRDCYYKLFKIYNDLNFDGLMGKYA
jgi:hypothetical protein